MVAGALLVEIQASAATETLSGRAEIIDGDTIIIRERTVRLYGIDAPEAGQRCRRLNGKTWKCGQAAIQALAGLIDGRKVRCEGREWDDFIAQKVRDWIGAVGAQTAYIEPGSPWENGVRSMLSQK